MISVNIKYTFYLVNSFEYIKGHPFKNGFFVLAKNK